MILVCYILLPILGIDIAHGFLQKMAKKSPKIFITFSYTY